MVETAAIMSLLDKIKLNPMF